MALLLLMNPVALLTVIATEAVPPTATGKVAPLVGARVNVSVVAVTVRLTVVETDAPPPVPVTVMGCTPDGTAMLAGVVMVRLTNAGDAPLSVKLDGLKLQSAPAGRPAVQLPGLEAVELVKFTVPVKPPAGVMVMADVVAGPVCPAETLRLDGLADRENGAVTVTAVGEDVELALIPL